MSPDIPIGMGAAARRILRAAAPFLPGDWDVPINGWEYRSEEPFDIGPFRVTPYLVDHSAYDSYALLVECAGKRLFYSGDFRAHGRKSALFDHLLCRPPIPIDALLLEGSSIGRISEDQTFSTESDLEEEMGKVFKEASGLALVHTSSQNLDRIVSVFRASRRTGRRLVIDLYTAVVLAATKNPNIPQSEWPDVALYIPQSQRVKIKKEEWFELLKRHASNRIYEEDLNQDPSKYTLMFRPLHQKDLERAGCLEGASYIYSQWEGYWERGDLRKTEEWLASNGILKESIHTSGHASLVDLKKLVSALNPSRVVPIHSFEPDRYCDLFPNVKQYEDGEWWEI